MTARLVAATYAACLISVLGLAACGGTGGTGSSQQGGGGEATDYASTGAAVRAEIADCLTQGGAEITRERDEISAAYEEVAALAKDGGIVRVYPLKASSSAKDTARQIEFELEEIRPNALAIVKPADSGHPALIGVMGNEQTEAKGTEFFPSDADVKLAQECAP